MILLIGTPLYLKLKKKKHLSSFTDKITLKFWDAGRADKISAPISWFPHFSRSPASLCAMTLLYCMYFRFSNSLPGCLLSGHLNHSFKCPSRDCFKKFGKECVCWGGGGGNQSICDTDKQAKPKTWTANKYYSYKTHLRLDMKTFS